MDVWQKRQKINGKDGDPKKEKKKVQVNDRRKLIDLQTLLSTSATTGKVARFTSQLSRLKYTICNDAMFNLKDVHLTSLLWLLLLH